VSTEERAARIAALAYDYAGREKEAVGSCNLCGSTRHVEACRRDRYGYPAVAWVCAGCGLGFLSPRLTAAEYTAFYAGTYRPLVSAYHGRTIDATTVQADQRQYAAELVDFLRRALPAPPSTVLDVGGSTGVVGGGIAAAFGARATVLDPSPDELAVAEAAGMAAIAGFIEDYDPKGQTWDLVLLCQTVDHLLDVAGALSRLREMTTEGGHAYVDILDVGYVLDREGAIEEAVKIDHPYYLTRDTALAYFARAGLEPVAERLSDDGHWGFLLSPGKPAQPDWADLESGAERLLAEIWRLRSER
jgi:SAM-dependent methyltransferase